MQVACHAWFLVNWWDGDRGEQTRHLQYNFQLTEMKITPSPYETIKHSPISDGSK